MGVRLYVNGYIHPKYKCLSILILFFSFLLLLFKYTCLHFPASIFPCPAHPHLPPSILPTFGFVHESFIHVPWRPFPYFPSLSSSPPSSLVTINLFFISMSLVIFCLLVCFVDYVPLTGEIICYLSFTTWLISLIIMLSSSIHTVTKGRSSFFLSAA